MYKIVSSAAKMESHFWSGNNFDIAGIEFRGRKSKLCFWPQKTLRVFRAQKHRLALRAQLNLTLRVASRTSSSHFNLENMIGKIKYGSSFAGVLNYSMQSHKGEMLDKNMTGNSPKELANEFQYYSSLNERVTKPVARFILGISNEDAKKLDNNQLKEITKEYLSKMGYPKESPYIAITHTDTDNKHIHLITSRITSMGNTISSKYDFYKSRKACQELELKYNLTRTRELRTVQEKAAEQNKNFDKSKKELTERKLREKSNTLDFNNVKSFLKIAVKQSISETFNEKDFSEKLKGKGITLLKNTAGNGYNFMYDGVKFKASEVGREFSYSKINESFRQKEKMNSILSPENEHIKHLKQNIMEKELKSPIIEHNIDNIDRISRLKRQKEQEQSPKPIQQKIDKDKNKSNEQNYDRT